jgi:hypothetical protein
MSAAEASPPESILYLLARLLEIGLRLVGLPLGTELVVTGDRPGRLLQLPFASSAMLLALSLVAMVRFLLGTWGRKRAVRLKKTDRSGRLAGWAEWGRCV